MLAKENRVKQKLCDGQVAVGFICRTLSPVVVELIGLAGFDFAWLDMEHTTADFSTIEHLCRAADAVGIESLVRVPDQNPSTVLRVLEAGAGIVNVPEVKNRAEAEAVVRAAKFAPQGERGMSGSTRGLRYGFGGSPDEILSAANARVMTMVQIESAEAVDNAAEICSVPHLDCVFVGLADLSQSLGVAGEVENPRVVDAASHVLAAARAAGKSAMMLVDNPDSGRIWLQQGARALCCGVDVPAFGKFLREKRMSFEILQSSFVGNGGR